MAGTDAPDDASSIASHTLAYLRSHDKKLDLILETLARHSERLGRLERDVGEIKSDIALLENKVISNQTEVLMILHQLDKSGND
jgi:hypothetical protein